jgi:hypothetical protein
MPQKGAAALIFKDFRIPVLHLLPVFVKNSKIYRLDAI